jgi:hypothetical protein
MPLNVRQFLRALQREGIKVGCDIHTYFETLIDGKWVPTWKPTPNVEYWYELIVEKKLDNGAADLAFTFEPEDNSMARYKKVSAYFEAMSIEEAEAKYGHDPLMQWDFNLPGTEYTERFRVRDYGFFGWAAKGVRSDHPDSFEQRGIPDDASPEVAREIETMGDDGHSHSWLMVDEMLANPGVQRFPQQHKWLLKNIENPEKTRLVFFFDN